jgi:hypothetical protein
MGPDLPSGWGATSKAMVSKKRIMVLHVTAVILKVVVSKLEGAVIIVKGVLL